MTAQDSLDATGHVSRIWHDRNDILEHIGVEMARALSDPSEPRKQPIGRDMMEAVTLDLLPSPRTAYLGD